MRLEGKVAVVTGAAAQAPAASSRPASTLPIRMHEEVTR